MGKHSGDSTKIVEEQLKAIATHCEAHSLSLAVKSLTKECPILRDTMATPGEVCVLVKLSPKRKKMLGKITDNIEGTFDEETINEQASKLNKLCITRWTICAIYFRKIIDSYKALLLLWNESLE